MANKRKPSVVLVGRPNVGKSTLFNRITGSRRAIVAPIAGTTRDSLERSAKWQDLSFQIFDTGGLYGASKDPLHELVVKQGQQAIVGADLVVFVCDGREGLVGGDQIIARRLRETGKPLLLAAAKTRPTTSDRAAPQPSLPSLASIRCSRSQQSMAPACSSCSMRSSKSSPRRPQAGSHRRGRRRRG